MLNIFKNKLLSSGLALTALVSGSAMAEGTSNPVTSAITGAVSGLNDVSSIIAVVAPIGIGIAIAFKVYGKGKSAVNKA